MVKRKLKPLLHQELIPWRYYPRYSRRGWVTRDVCIGGQWYKFLSSGIKPDGLMCYYVRDDFTDREPPARRKQVHAKTLTGRAAAADVAQNPDRIEELLRRC